LEDVSLQLGRYRLEEQVGQGGMAVVWRGFDTQLKRTVAVKVLHPHLHAREDIRRRFDREAQAVARLHHPHILDVYDFSGLSAQPSYLVTEFIRGTTLRVFADQHAFDPPDLAAACLLPIAEALEHAHAAGVVHRDLKPENVMVREDGVVKLTDFGIAALLDPDEKFTATGAILGSPAHLAPETIEGKPAEPRSDLFSFGTIFYWLSTGQLPFQAPSPAALLRAILEEPMKDPRLVRPSISDAQARLIGRCLERDPGKRIQSARELRGELEALLADAGIEHPLEVLARFVRAPEEEAARVRAQLVATALKRGEQELSRKRTSAALAAFGRALALDPSNEAARGRVERIRRRARAVKLGKRVGVALAAGAALALFAVPVARLAERARAAFSKPPPPAVAEQKPAAEQKAADPSPPAATASSTPSEAAQQEAAEPPPHHRVRTSRKAPQNTAKVARVEPRPMKVRLRLRYPAELVLDGKSLGNQLRFDPTIEPGRHHIVIRNMLCCDDYDGSIDVGPNRDDYGLPVGTPKPARLRVLNADPDAPVYLSDESRGPVLIASVRDLPSTPVQMGVPEQDMTITVGEQRRTRTIRAGMMNTIDLGGEP
jgi:eukaryotic-like serine/threonine-protein kinase